MEPTPPTTPPSPPPTPDPAPRRLLRSREDRVLGGVAGGLGRYLGVDPVLVRIALVVLILAGGAGLLVYAACLVLVPAGDEVPGSHSPGPSFDATRLAGLTTAGLVVLVVVSALLVSGLGLGLAALLVPLTTLALAGLAVWWFAAGERPQGTPGDIARRAAVGIGVLIGCAVLAFAAFWTAGIGGGVGVAAALAVTGAGLVVGARRGWGRWLVLPAVALALPLGVVSAADLDLRGGVGERVVRPADETAIKPAYRLGTGELKVDLRGVALSPGDHRVSLKVGMGHALLIVDPGVCVSASSSVRAGYSGVLGRENGGLDVDVDDPRVAPEGRPRVVVSGDVGLGAFEVLRHDPSVVTYDDGRVTSGGRHSDGDTGDDGCRRSAA